MLYSVEGWAFATVGKQGFFLDFTWRDENQEPV
jgi:hypothetical protein